MERQTIVDMALNAYSLEECFFAEDALTRWLSSHPGDLGLHEIAGQLGIMRGAALEREADTKIGSAAFSRNMPALR